MQYPSHFQDTGTAGQVVIRPLFDIAFEQVGGENDLIGIRICIRTRDVTDQILQLMRLHFSFDLGMDRDFFTGQEPGLEEFAFPAGKVESKLGNLLGGASPTSNSPKRELNGIGVRTH